MLQNNKILKTSNFDILFSKIAIRLYKLKKKSTEELLLVDLLRDEIKLLIFLTILNQIQRVCTNPNFRKKAATQSITFIIRKILISSKRKIFQILKAEQIKYRESALININSLIDSETHIGFTLFTNHFYSLGTISNTLPLQILLEHTVLQLSELLVYDVFLNLTYPSFLLNQWVVDSILFKSYLGRMQIYLRVKAYLNNKMRNEMQVIPETDSLLILTEAGITRKQVHFKSVPMTVDFEFQSRLIQILAKPLKCMGNNLYKFIILLTKN